ncbi:hypothetical protein EDD22DRAFT_959764 [Suillus occidentalis]|nr:hypothetical protein EDD22DRAFT_959764 [Suillus occidentalis]
MASPEYNFNFNPPPPLYGHPSTPAGHAYSGMVGSHEMGRVMYQGSPTGMSDGCPMSIPALTPGLSSHELQRPASVVPIIDPQLTSTASGGIGTGTSSAQNTSGPPKSMKISQVLSEMTSFNRQLAQAEDSELQHANELYAVETRCIQHVKAVKIEFKAKIKSLEEQFEQKVASLLASKSHVDVGDGSEDETDEEFEQDVEKLERSALAFSDNGLKAVVHMVFQMLMGSAKLTVDVLPSYPSDENKWPLDPATNEHLMHFHWTESHQHPDNHANILCIITYICQHGTTVCAGTGPTLRDISDEDLCTHVVIKYQDLQKNLWKAGRLSGHLVVPLTGVASTVEDDPLRPSAQPVSITTTSRAKLQSHARGKLEVCIRKYENLPEDSEFGHEKYRAALTESLMSQDEDEVSVQGKKTGQFVSHAGTYRSDLMSRFLAAVDEAADPHPPPRFTAQVKGDSKELPLLAAKKIENRAC